MASCLITKNISLQQRLRKYKGKRIELAGAGFSLEPGLLQKICARSFIIVTNESFVPLTLDTLTILNVKPIANPRKAGISTTFDTTGQFDNIRIVMIGKDFVELQGREGAPNVRVLIPLNKVGRIYNV